MLDESVKSKKSKQLLTTCLRKELNASGKDPKINEVRYHKSHADNLIQATDMLSGAIYARYHKGNSEFFDFIRMKIGDLWEWHPRTQ